MGTHESEDVVHPKEIVRRGYDAISLAYRSDDADDGTYARWITRLRTHIPASGAVLDLGCGCGIPVCRILDKCGYSVTGVDISAVQIERARKLVPKGMFIHADATEVSFPPASFDAVVCLFALIHIPLAEQLPLLQRVAGWLRPGGGLLLTAGHTALTGTEQDWYGAPMWWSLADAATYETWLDQAGLRVQESEFFHEGDGGHTVFFASRSREA
jgi:ubiquinone/menaquinone biosynthesis C-methylase UbiE